MTAGGSVRDWLTLEMNSVQRLNYGLGALNHIEDQARLQTC